MHSTCRESNVNVYTYVYTYLMASICTCIVNMQYDLMIKMRAIHIKLLNMNVFFVSFEFNMIKAFAK